MQHTATTTIASLQRKADERIDFNWRDIETPDNEYGHLYMSHDCDVYDGERGCEYAVRGVECIGAVVLGNDAGDFAAPIILNADEAHSRFGTAAIVTVEEFHLASLQG